ncbi:MAG TPA: hypothetical protein PK082_02360 [Phycisphaerae bacterium]|nr:hypothetical protein [Phycisphaerae bacterium]
MALIRKALMALTAAQDDSDGALLVRQTDAVVAALEALAAAADTENQSIRCTIVGGSAVINVDMAEVDVTALVDGIAGEKTLEDLSGQLPESPGEHGGLPVEGVEGGTPVSVSGPLTDEQLRDSAIEVEEASAAAILAAAIGTGAPIPRQFTDPASDAYTAAATAPGRACTRIRFGCGAGGMILSLDGGTTESIRVPANTVDEICVSIAADAALKAKRIASGVAFADAWIEVR